MKHVDGVRRRRDAADGPLRIEAGAAPQRYAEILAGAGVERGLLGPREVDRLWDRHIFNSAAVAELLEPASGLRTSVVERACPGYRWRWPGRTSRLTLIEPLLRRSEFLREVVDELGLDDQMVRGRAEDRSVREQVGEMDAVVSRAVASLGQADEVERAAATSGRPDAGDQGRARRRRDPGAPACDGVARGGRCKGDEMWRGLLGSTRDRGRGAARSATVRAPSRSPRTGRRRG